jgi:hypothetical protein
MMADISAVGYGGYESMVVAVTVIVMALEVYEAL